VKCGTTLSVTSFWWEMGNGNNVLKFGGKTAIKTDYKNGWPSTHNPVKMHPFTYGPVKTDSVARP